MEEPRVKRFCATEFSLPLLLLSELVFIVAKPSPRVKVEEPDVEDPSAERTRSSSTAHFVASVSQWISNMDSLSFIHKFVGRTVVDVKFAETEDQKRSYLRARVKHSRRK